MNEDRATGFLKWTNFRHCGHFLIFFYQHFQKKSYLRTNLDNCSIVQYRKFQFLRKCREYSQKSIFTPIRTAMIRRNLKIEWHVLTQKDCTSSQNIHIFNFMLNCLDFKVKILDRHCVEKKIWKSWIKFCRESKFRCNDPQHLQILHILREFKIKLYLVSLMNK